MVELELTAFQIADAFPEECLEYIPKAIKMFDVMIIETREKYALIESMPIDDKIKQTYRLFVDSDGKISKYRKLITKYTEALKLTKELENKKYLDRIHRIALAKAKPIETFMTLEKQKMSSARIHGKCPLGTHEDSSPSFVIYRGTNTFHCFSCKESGDSIALFMKINNCDFNTALKGINHE